MAIVATLAVLAVFFVASTLRRPVPPTFAPTAALPREAGPRLVGPVRVTVDATGERAWRRFDLSRGAVVEDADWDLAFRRTRIVANGGPGFGGQGGIRDLGRVAFDSIAVVPASGYRVNAAGRDTLNPATERWYDYGLTTHVLTPKPRVYAVRTADGRYAKLEILGYYCPGLRGGCVTFRYAYQGDGSRRVR